MVSTVSSHSSHNTVSAIVFTPKTLSFAPIITPQCTRGPERGGGILDEAHITTGIRPPTVTSCAMREPVVGEHPRELFKGRE